MSDTREGTSALWRLLTRPIRPKVTIIRRRPRPADVIAASGLPEPTKALIARLVRRTRLWRRERADVAGELVSHFEEAIGAGASPEDAARLFGDPLRAARLIRRSKKRARGLVWHAWVRTWQAVGALFLVFAALYAVLAVRLFTGSPTIARNYVAEHNARTRAIPAEERAYELYIEGLLALERPPDSIINVWPSISARHPAYADALAHLERSRGAIELIHRAAARPHLGAPLSDALDPRVMELGGRRYPYTDHMAVAEPSENPPLIAVLLPELGYFRELARLLTFDMHTAADAGDGERIVRDTRTLLGIVRHLREPPAIISDLVGTAIFGLALNTVGGVMHAHPRVLSDEQLREIAHRIAAFDQAALTPDLAKERRVFEDFLQRVYTDDGRGGGRLTAEGIRFLTRMETWGAGGGPVPTGISPLAPIATSLMAGRGEMLREYDRLLGLALAAYDRPLWELSSPVPGAEIDRTQESPLYLARYFPAALLFPAMKAVLLGPQRVMQERDGVLTGIALELYRRRHGEHPSSLEALVPDLLPSLPIDRFTGGTLGYAVVDGEARLWSVGADRKDDGGRPPASPEAQPFRWVPAGEVAARLAGEHADLIDGDWVLWPLPYEPHDHDYEPADPPG